MLRVAALTTRSGKSPLHVLLFFVNFRPRRFALVEDRGSPPRQCGPFVLKLFLCSFECSDEIPTPRQWKRSRYDSQFHKLHLRTFEEPEKSSIRRFCEKK
ncbi:hypothetical protein TRVL_08336 [Trypanosoma vivax]|nr:hypothetical protein TRVL_08336 [Trypanosoma vivax]